MTFILPGEGQIMLILCKPPSVLLRKITISHLLNIYTKAKKEKKNLPQSKLVHI